ncbi:hypothetical protein [Pontibacter fetidus]|uniref:DUF3997 domain-containing protein n=1 Tax=Pontibacter fetidus TaxID=2700082 RepID=A0A6B2H466_9BACT|nr:hypothetical protein [Pontibacter fetidus]NDK55416.1 hypothetical protein [Pontibacter fetidus]
MRTIIIISIFSLSLFGCSEGYPELGKGYKIVGEGGYTTAVVNNQNTIVVSEYILDYATDSTFVLIAQSPPDSLPEMKFFYYSDNDRKEIAANKNVFRQYWIINKKENDYYSYDSTNQVARYSNVYGPYNRSQYYEQCINLNVPKNLKLKND